jgi:hypothetical protein
MKRKAVLFGFCVTVLTAAAFCAPKAGHEQSIIISTNPVKPVITEEKAEVTPAFKPFYVYTDEGSKDNHYAPTGWMGDASAIKFTGSYQADVKLGKTCLKLMYTAQGPKEWMGIYWQQPANNWGEKKGGYDLRGAMALTFWAKGESGGEKISEIKCGGITGKFPDSDIAWIGPIKLSKEWKQYKISLKGKDMSYINGGFCVTVLKVDNPHGCTFFLDEIRYE